MRKAKMSKAFFVAAFVLVGVALTATSAPAPVQKPKAGHAKKDGLSLTVALDKKSYGPADEVVLRFVLKNETDKALFVGDGYLAPGYHEAGPGRHFEVHVKAGRKAPLYFWSGLLTEGHTSGIRKVFKLKPGEEYSGPIRLSAGAEKDKKYAALPHEERGGSFEDKAGRQGHVLGKDARTYTAELRYQVNGRGAWKPPADFKDELLWRGSLTSAPLEFEVSAK
jgi:hypothetical protein